MKLKDYIESDMSTFFNSDEFAELHNVGGRELPVIVDNDTLVKRTRKEYEGIYIGDLLFYIDKSRMGRMPKPGQLMTFDSVPYEVFSANDVSGMFEIILKASES